MLTIRTEDILINENHQETKRFNNLSKDRIEVAQSLFGILPKEVDIDEAKEERLNIK